MMNKIRFTFLSLLALICTGLFCACSSDDDLSKKPVQEDYMAMAKTLLDGDVVLNTKSMINGVDKTLLPNGCPAKYHFSWMADNKMKLDMVGFFVGSMPFKVYYSCVCTFVKLNSWDKGEYTGEGWVKFEGQDGVVRTDYNDKSGVKEGSGSTVKGYLNVKTQQIIFDIDFNMMNVHSTCILQKIDKSRIERFAEEKAQYEEQLKAHKAEKGLKP